MRGVRALGAAIVCVAAVSCSAADAANPPKASGPSSSREAATAPSTSGVATAPAPGNASTASGAATIRPPIVTKRIPYGARRRREMAAYSRRHYGKRTWRLRHPHVIVEHYTDGHSFSSAWNYFASNVPDLGELPGVCAHFIVDTDGTIYQLVDLRVRCRHAVGMNWTAIGVEHVGTSDREILTNRRQMRA